MPRTLEEEFELLWNSLTPPLPITLLLSGGGDSVALFHLLRAIKVDFQALHFVHDGDADFAQRSRAFCQELCTRHQTSLECVEVKGKDLVAKGDLSWEAACRRLRYGHLASKSGSFLTAHTLDDQAETVIMSLLQGGGLAALAGIRPVRTDGVLRPLLSFSRDRLRTYLSVQSQLWLEDPSNRDGNERARLRHRILPLLLQYKPNLLPVLGRTAGRLLEDENYLLEATQNWLNRETLEGGDSWLLPEVQALPPAILVRFLKLLWKSMTGEEYRPRSSFFEECTRLIKRGTNEGMVTFPGGWSLLVLGSKLWLRPVLSNAHWQLNFEEAALGLVHLQGSLILSPEPVSGGEGWKVPPGAVLRSRHPRDRFDGKCLKKLLAEKKQPPWVRDRWPVMELDGKVVAVWKIGALNWVKTEPNVWLDFRPEFLRANIIK